MNLALRDEERAVFTLRGRPWYYLALYYAALISLWAGAWYLHDRTSLRDLSPRDTLAYWTLAKLVIWIGPILLIVTRAFKEAPAAYLGLVRFRRGARAGLAVGAIFVALAATVDAFTRSHGLPEAMWGTLNALIVAPVLEEVVFRGFALKALEQSGCRFWPANGIAGVLFLGLHLPGWHFTRGLDSSSIAAGLSVVSVGMAAGYAKHRSNSTWASVTVHFLNNAYAAFLR